MVSTLLALVLAAGWPASSAQQVPTKTSPSKISLADDLGPSTIDVSAYPPEYQETYRKIFIPVFKFFGGTARAVNSPIIELDPRLEAAERKAHPGLFSNPLWARVSGDGWKKQVELIHNRPPCCGACPILSMKDAKALWRFLVYDSIVRKTGTNAENWLENRRQLLEQFQRQYPERFAQINSDELPIKKEKLQ